MTDSTPDRPFTARPVGSPENPLHLIRRDFLGGSCGCCHWVRQEAAGTIFTGHRDPIPARYLKNYPNRSLSPLITQLLEMANYDPETQAYTNDRRGVMVLGEPGLGKTMATQVLREMAGSSVYHKMDIGALRDTKSLIEVYDIKTAEGRDDIFDRFETALNNSKITGDGA